MRYCLSRRFQVFGLPRNSLVNSGNGQIIYSNLSSQTDLFNNIIQPVTGKVPNVTVTVASVPNPATLYGAIQWRLSIKW